MLSAVEHKVSHYACVCVCYDKLMVAREYNNKLDSLEIRVEMSNGAERFNCGGFCQAMLI